MFFCFFYKVMEWERGLRIGDGNCGLGSAIFRV